MINKVYVLGKNELAERHAEAWRILGLDVHVVSYIKGGKINGKGTILDVCRNLSNRLELPNILGSFCKILMPVSVYLRIGVNQSFQKNLLKNKVCPVYVLEYHPVVKTMISAARKLTIGRPKIARFDLTEMTSNGDTIDVLEMICNQFRVIELLLQLSIANFSFRVTQAGSIVFIGNTSRSSTFSICTGTSSKCTSFGLELIGDKGSLVFKDQCIHPQGVIRSSEAIWNALRAVYTSKHSSGTCLADHHRKLLHGALNLNILRSKVFWP
jgi:hypothetical protein